MSKTLFEIGDDIRALEALLTEIEGDVSDEEIEKTIDDWLLENRSNLKEKLDGYAWLITERKRMSEARLEESKRIKALATADQNLSDRLKNRLKFFFEEYGIEREETLNFKFWIQNNGGALPLWFNEEDFGGSNAVRLPEEYQKTLVIPDMESIRRDAEELYTLELAKKESEASGNKFPLLEESERRIVELREKLQNIAKVSQRGTHLRIK